MKKISSLILFYFILISNIQSQPYEHKSFEKNLKSDFELFHSILKDTHAGLYKYHSKAQIDSVFNSYKDSVSNQTDIITFYRYLSSIMSYIGSLHDDIDLPDSVIDTMIEKKEFFPYPIKIVDHKLLVNIGEQLIPAGAEIISINNVKATDILTRLYKYYTTDGYNITGKTIGINSKFPWYYRLEFGGKKTFKVVYKTFQQKNKKSVKIPASTYQQYKSLYAHRHSIALDTLLNKRYSFKIIDSISTGILTIPTFSLGGEKSLKHQAYKEFLRNTFTTLRKDQIKNLIVDIRKNGGGSDPNDLLTFSYLAQKPYKENSEAYTIFQKVPYQMYFVLEDSSDIIDIEENFAEEHDQFSNGKYYQNNIFNPLWYPDTLAFKGKIYLLTGPAVASAASLFASMVKSEKHAIVVGEETMGGYYGHTGHNSVSYQLPYTKIIFSFSVVDLEQYVVPLKEIPEGHGIIPDITVIQSQEDFIKNRDTQLDYILELIGTKK